MFMCNSITLVKIFYYVGIIIKILKIIIPLAIIVFGSIDLAKAVLSGDDKALIDKAWTFAKRLIAGITIFFIPTIINVFLGYSNESYDKESFACLLNVTKENILNVEISLAEEKVSKAESTNSEDDYNIAMSYIKLVEDENTRNLMKKRMQSVSEIIKANNKINKSTSTNKKSTITRTVNNTNNAKTNTSGIKSSIKYYSQCGNNSKINVNGKTYNNCNCGCGFTSMAMVIDTLNNSSYGPSGILNNFNPSNYASSYCAVNDSTFTSSKFKSDYNIIPTLLFERNRKASEEETENRKSKIVNALNNGNIVILLVPGHYITLGGIENGKIITYDPANSGNNGKYTIDELYNKYKDHKRRCSLGAEDGTIACGFVMAISYRKA